MTEYRMLKRTILLLGAMLGCLCGFVGLMVGAGAMLQRVDEDPIFTLTDRPQNVSLPCRVEGTDLIACQLVLYEGPYLEDGGDIPVSEVTALVLRNVGEQEIAQAEVKLTAGEELVFFASNIMPGTQLLVLEQNGSPWQDWKVTACTGWISEGEGTPLGEEVLQIQEVDMGTLAVTNPTQQTLKDIWLYYKNYIPEGELYIGGITYIETIDALGPGQTVRISPSRYAQGYSKIIKVEVVS